MEYDVWCLEYAIYSVSDLYDHTVTYNLMISIKIDYLHTNNSIHYWSEYELFWVWLVVKSNKLKEALDEVTKHACLHVHK